MAEICAANGCSNPRPMGTEYCGECRCDTCQNCEQPAQWRWWNGKGCIGKYCDDHACEELDTDIPSYKDPMTIESTAGNVIPGGGIMPVDSSFPVIRHQEFLDMWLAYSRNASFGDSNE